MPLLWSQNCISRGNRFPCYGTLSETALCEDLTMRVKEILPKYLIATSVLVDGEGSLITDWLGLFRLNLCPCISSERKRESGEAERAFWSDYVLILTHAFVYFWCGGRKMLIAEADQDKRKKERVTVWDSFCLQKVLDFLPLTRI